VDSDRKRNVSIYATGGGHDRKKNISNYATGGKTTLENLVQIQLGSTMRRKFITKPQYMFEEK
jgi:hypothetical protein